MTSLTFTCFLLLSLTLACSARVLHTDDESDLHPEAPYEDSHFSHRIFMDDDEEKNPSFWREKAASRLKELVQRKNINKRAKNVIFFIGDGMSIATLAASRVYMGDENQVLSFETFPFTGLAKTYCVDAQVADSACTATAYLCGVKANYGTMGLSANVLRKDKNCLAQRDHQVDSILALAQRAGKGTGIVTTTRVTHASPGGTYSHIADRDWEDDQAVIKDGGNPSLCPDIATQLVTQSPGKDFNVIMGGGRERFLPKSVPADKKGNYGMRGDGKDLIQAWKDSKNGSGVYVDDKQSLHLVDTGKVEYLLGLFDASHMQYSLDNDTSQPSLAEMTETAIRVLSKKKEGYFLFVEGGRIDTAHHDSFAHYALDETVGLSAAVQRAVDMTSIDDTLIVVSSDHGHTMSLSGYAKRGSNIFRFGGTGTDDKPYSILGYANGPGYKKPVGNERPDQTSDDSQKFDYQFPASAPKKRESHSGADVAIFARGPYAHLYTGVLEQHVIPHIMLYAADLGAYEGSQPNGVSQTRALSGVVVLLSIFCALRTLWSLNETS